MKAYMEFSPIVIHVVRRMAARRIIKDLFTMLELFRIALP